MQDASAEREWFHTQVLAVLDQETMEFSPEENNAGLDHNHNNGSMNGQDD